ncbi:MAG: hypothetical protein NTU41_10925 [Chloroflexi bacterium]|nr:hypothetical protein [Chloroflexota bacterium]
MHFCDIDSREAYRLGLVNKVVPSESVMDEARSLAKRLGGKTSNGFEGDESPC